jgi:hypothetical protein
MATATFAKSVILLASFLALQKRVSRLNKDAAKPLPPIVMLVVFSSLSAVNLLNACCKSNGWALRQLARCHASSSA